MTSVVGWSALAAGVAALGWSLGMRFGPVPGGCSCFNPLGLPFVLGWGPLGALLALMLFSAASGGIGLALYVWSRRRARRSGVEASREIESDLEDWLQEG